MRVRTLLRFIQRHFTDGRYYLSSNDTDSWVFRNVNGRFLGVIDRGKYFDLYDSNNPKDTPENPTGRISKGKLKFLFLHC